MDAIVRLHLCTTTWEGATGLAYGLTPEAQTGSVVPCAPETGWKDACSVHRNDFAVDLFLRSIVNASCQAGWIVAKLVLQAWVHGLLFPPLLIFLFFSAGGKSKADDDSSVGRENCPLIDHRGKVEGVRRFSSGGMGRSNDQGEVQREMRWWGEGGKATERGQGCHASDMIRSPGRSDRSGTTDDLQCPRRLLLLQPSRVQLSWDALVFLWLYMSARASYALPMLWSACLIAECGFVSSPPHASIPLHPKCILSSRLPPRITSKEC